MNCMLSNEWRALKLKPLNLSNFNTENVTEMNQMFYDCYCLEYLDLSTFNIKNVKSMKRIFLNICQKILNISNFNAPNGDIKKS